MTDNSHRDEEAVPSEAEFNPSTAQFHDEPIASLTSTVQDLNREVSAFSRQVRALRQQLTISREQVARLRVVTTVMVGLILAGLALGVVTYNNVQANQRTAERGCENANESRRGALLLWTTVIDAPRDPKLPPRTRSEKELLSALKQFVSELYKERDCTDLDREYPLPAVPPALVP